MTRSLSTPFFAVLAVDSNCLARRILETTLPFYHPHVGCEQHKRLMRIAKLLALVAAVALTAGCAGPEKKLGRGVMNVTEFARLGEVRRSMEQTHLWENTDSAYSTGLIRGVNRSVARTAIGVYEIITFPFPSYDPIATSKDRTYPDPNMRNRKSPWGGMVLSEYPVYPDSYKPSVISDSIFSTDTSLGFSGGDVAPFVPGSRFRIFDN
jgi:putative exosortase-associated protein (TIGR04073 family)